MGELKADNQDQKEKEQENATTTTFDFKKLVAHQPYQLDKNICAYISDRGINQRRIQLELKKIYQVACFYQDCFNQIKTKPERSPGYQSKLTVLSIKADSVLIFIESGTLQGYYTLPFDESKLIK